MCIRDRPYGVSYNSYLIVDEKTVLVDTVDVCYSDIFLKKIADALDGRPLDFLIVNHMEPDHAGSIRLLRQQYPDVQIIGNKQTFGMLNGYHGISTGLYEVKEGDTLSVGRHQLSFYMAPMVHWPEMCIRDRQRQLLIKYRFHSFRVKKRIRRKTNRSKSEFRCFNI